MDNTLRYNNTVPGNIYYNNTKVKKLYYNNTLVWSSSPIDGTLSVGNTITFDNKVWRVVHNDGNLWYLGLETMTETCQYARGYGTYYDTSIIYQKCVDYLSNFSAEAQQIMQTVDVSADGNTYPTAKVFIPNYSMIKTDFSYYVTEANRICKLNETPYRWWLSSLVGTEPRFVETNGSVYNKRDDPAKRYGFRPHICIQV